MYPSRQKEFKGSLNIKMKDSEMHNYYRGKKSLANVYVRENVTQNKREICVLQ